MPSNQSGLWDREVEDQDLEDAGLVLLDAEKRRTYREVEKAKKTVKERVAAHGLKNGERLRCGQLIFPGRKVERGENVIGAFSVVTAKRPTRVPE